MKVLAVQPTPNPNSMRVELDFELPMSESYNYKKRDVENAEQPAKSVLEVEGVEGVYHVMNFMAVERDPSVEWDVIIPKIEQAINNQ